MLLTYSSDEDTSYATMAAACADDLSVVTVNCPLLLTNAHTPLLLTNAHTCTARSM